LMLATRMACCARDGSHGATADPVTQEARDTLIST
jgi:hypothetical protein